MMHGAYGLDTLYRWAMPDGMSCGRQYTVAPDIKGAGEKWHPGEILDNKKESHRVTPPVQSENINLNQCL